MVCSFVYAQLDISVWVGRLVCVDFYCTFEPDGKGSCVFVQLVL